MGANYSSTLHEANNISTRAQVKSSQVIAFHSSTKWKLHFDALKDTNKLVTILETLHKDGFNLNIQTV